MNNVNYFIREAQGNWTACNAQTLAAAKRAAVRGQMFQGTDAWVGLASGSRIEPVAVKRADALNMSNKGRWIELDPDYSVI